MTSTAQNQRTALERAAHISLFTWRRAEPSDSVDDADRQGWWGDSVPAEAGDRIGSRLWLLRRQTITADTIRRAQHYCEEALQWLLDDGHITALEVAMERPSTTRLTARITLSRPDGDPMVLDFDDLLQVAYGV